MSCDDKARRGIIESSLNGEMILEEHVVDLHGAYRRFVGFPQKQKSIIMDGGATYHIANIFF